MLAIYFLFGFGFAASAVENVGEDMHWAVRGTGFIFIMLLWPAFLAKWIGDHLL